MTANPKGISKIDRQFNRKGAGISTAFSTRLFATTQNFGRGNGLRMEGPKLNFTLHLKEASVAALPTLAWMENEIQRAFSAPACPSVSLASGIPNSVHVDCKQGIQSKYLIYKSPVYLGKFFSNLLVARSIFRRSNTGILLLFTNRCQLLSVGCFSGWHTSKP